MRIQLLSRGALMTLTLLAAVQSLWSQQVHGSHNDPAVAIALMAAFTEGLSLREETAVCVAEAARSDESAVQSPLPASRELRDARSEVYDTASVWGRFPKRWSECDAANNRVVETDSASNNDKVAIVWYRNIGPLSEARFRGLVGYMQGDYAEEKVCIVERISGRWIAKGCSMRWQS